MAKAFGIFINDQGYDCNDGDIDLLKNNITKSIKEIKTVYESDNISFSIPSLEVIASISGNNGYIKFGKFLGGMILNYGFFSIGPLAGTGTIVTYPIAYRYKAVLYFKVVANAADQEIGMTNPSTTQVQIQKGSSDATARTGLYYVLGI